MRYLTRWTTARTVILYLFEAIEDEEGGREVMQNLKRFRVRESKLQ